MPTSATTTTTAIATGSRIRTPLGGPSSFHLSSMSEGRFGSMVIARSFSSFCVDSFVTERVDGTQGRRPVGGIDAEEQADGEGDTERERDRVTSDHRLDADDLELAA